MRLSGIGAAAAASMTLATAVLLGPAAAQASTPTNTGKCTDVMVFASRGSGEAWNSDVVGFGRTLSAQYRQLQKKAPRAQLSAVSNTYTAISVNNLNAALSLTKGGLTFYDNSVNQGIAMGKRLLETAITKCPKAAFMLFGFSQGAQVNDGIMARLTKAHAAHVVAAFNFGDAMFNPALPLTIGTFSTNRSGFRGKNGSYGYVKKVVSMCHSNDAVCQGPKALSLSGHFNYDKETAPSTLMVKALQAAGRRV
nr:cutinase family protein [uncultured Actinoplanes sp.]